MLKPADAWDHLRLKEKLIESDHVAVFSDGRRLPIYIYEPKGRPRQLLVEIDQQFGPPEAAKGYVRREKIHPEAPVAVINPPVVPDNRIKGSTWHEMKVNAEKKAKENLAAIQAGNRSQNSWITQNRREERNG
jgi:hypothetical protein